MLQYIEEARGNDAIPRAMRIAVAAGSKFGALSGAAMMLVIGLYLAMAPRVSRYGLVRLMPLSVRARIDEVLVTCDKALSRWLLGQSVSMLFVGATTALGLWLLDVPLALSVGVLSGLLGFMQGPESTLRLKIGLGHPADRRQCVDALGGTLGSRPATRARHCSDRQARLDVWPAGSSLGSSSHDRAQGGGPLHQRGA